MAWIFLFFACAVVSMAQVNAGPDITVSAGLPVTLSATYDGYTGIPVEAEDDYFVGPFDIGFNFTFFGSTYSQFAIGPNGIVSFDVPSVIGFSFWDAAPIPNGDFKKSIMGPYQDLFSRPTAAHTRYIYYQLTGAAPDRKLVVGWCEAPMFNCPDKFLTAQIVLCETTGYILNHLFVKPECNANFGNRATQGLNLDPSVGVVVPGRNWTSWVASEETWLYMPDGPSNYIVNLQPFNPEPVSPPGTLQWFWTRGSTPGGETIANEAETVVYPQETTTYVAGISMCGGIKFFDDVKVTVIPVPNAFRPSSAIEENRTFHVFASPPEKVTDFTLSVFNKWGDLVFSTEDPNEGWDGTYDGKKCDAGVYTWIFALRQEKRKVTNKGTVTLVR